MDNAIFGHAADGDWEELSLSCLERMGPPPGDANLGFLYVTDMLADELPRTVSTFRERTGVAHWIGTIGIGVMAGTREYYGKPAIAAMLGTFPDDAFRVLPPVAKPGNALDADVTRWIERAQPMLGVVHADPNNAYVPEILDSISDDTDAFLVGGLTSSRGRHAQLADSVTEGGVCGALFAGNVPVACGLSQGCAPVGGVHEVTAADDNVIAELGGRAALDVFREDVGEALLRSPERARIHAALPISGDDTGDYLVRNLLGIDTRQKLIAIGDRISPGDRVMFVRRDAEAAAEDLDRMLEDVTGRVNGPPKAALYISCVARGPNLFGSNSEEVKAVQAALGEDVPLVGFFANGEISKNRLYGYTGVLTVFS